LSEPKLMRKPLAVACIALFLLSATTMLAFSFRQAIAADQGIVIQGADYNSTNVTAYSSGLVSVAGNVTQRIVMEYADFNIERGLSSSNDLISEAALVTPRITVEYADYLSTNGFVAYLGPNNGSFTILPSIDSITRTPSGNVSDNQSVIASAVVSDVGSGVQNATLQYNLNNGTDWVNVPMDLNLTVYPKDSLLLSYSGTVPGQPNGTYVSFRIVAWDYHGNSATSANGTPYTVVPEFPSIMILLLFMIATLFVITAYKRKHFHSMRGKDGK